MIFKIHHMSQWAFGLHNHFSYYDQRCCVHRVHVQKSLLRIASGRISRLCREKWTPGYRWLHTTKVGFLVGESQGPSWQRLQPPLAVSPSTQSFRHLAGEEGQCRAAEGFCLLQEWQMTLSTFPLPEVAIWPSLMQERQGEDCGAQMDVCDRLFSAT